MSSIYAAKFQLGHALVHSLDRSDIPSGIQILEELVKKHHDSDARRDYSKYSSIVQILYDWVIYLIKQFMAKITRDFKEVFDELSQGH